MHVGLQTILDNGHLESVTIGPGLVQKQTASEAGHQDKALKQNNAPGTLLVDTVPQPASGQAAASDPHRKYWSDLAANGLEIMKASQGATQTNVAGLDRTRGRTV